MKQPNFPVPSKIQAIIFDCDGTLVDSEESHFRSWSQVFAKAGCALSKEYYIQEFSGLGDREVSHQAAKLIGTVSAEQLLRDKYHFFSLFQKEGVAPIAATVAFLHLLQSEKSRHGLKLAVASGARRREILLFLRVLQVERFFDVVLSGCEDLSDYFDPEGTNKPKPYIYLKTAHLLQVPPENCIAIEDSRVGVASAVKAGCFTVAIPNSYTRDQDLSQAHYQLDSLEGLSVEQFLSRISRQ